ncbi:hypothetical protein F4776DRAFT_619810 [Hypoxylon sp. NC0597]|nr:hypothetical protein F4776DRAFT_619810 [Hypoxylon sp. NC0597]
MYVHWQARYCPAVFCAASLARSTKLPGVATGADLNTNMEINLDILVLVIRTSRYPSNQIEDCYGVMKPSICKCRKTPYVFQLCMYKVGNVISGGLARYVCIPLIGVFSAFTYQCTLPYIKPPRSKT